MRNRRAWNAYVSTYMLVLGVGMLFLPPDNGAVPFVAADAVWVRVDGMLCVSIAYFNYALAHEHHLPFLRVNVLCQGAAAAVVTVLAIVSRSAVVAAIAALVWAGFAGSALSLPADGVAAGPAGAALPLTARWNLYVAGYTFVYGIATGLLPHLLLPRLGFSDPQGPWVRLAGVLFFSLLLINVIAFREKGTRRVILAIITFRIWIVVNLVVFGLLGYPWFVYASAVIVGFGVAGTI